MRGQTAIVVIDMQNDFCDASGFYARRGRDSAALSCAIPNIAHLLATGRRLGYPIAYTRLVYDRQVGPPEDRHDIMPAKFTNAGPRLRSGSWGAAVIDELSPQPGDFIADKHGYSAFVATGLRRWLIAGGVKTVILTGTVTYGCVLATAYSAFDLGFDVLVAADAVSAWSVQIGRMALDIVELLIGRVVSTDDLVSTMASDQLPIGVWDS